MKTHVLFKPFFVLTFLSIFSFLNSQTIIETFDNNNFTTDDYGDGSFVGDGGIVWNYTDVRSHTYAAPNPGDLYYAACYVNTSTLEAVYPNGIGYVSFKARSWAASSNVIFEVRINDTVVGTFDLYEVPTVNSILALKPLPNDTLTIQKIGGSTRGTIDDIEVREISPIPNDDNTLSSLSNAGGPLVPAFDSAILNYSVELLWGTLLTPITTAVVNNILSSVVITDAVDVTSGTPADRTTSIVVTAEDATQQTYEILFSIAPPSSDATLGSLSSSEGVLSPLFDAGTFSYTIELPYNWTLTPTIIAIPNNAGGIVSITDAVDVNSAIAAERTSTILVTAQDASTETYTIEFNVSTVPSTDATLSGITTAMGSVSPTFDPGTFVYDMLLPFGTVNSPAIIAVPSHDSAIIVVVDAVDISSNVAVERTSTITVTAQDGLTTETYTILFEISATVGGGEVKWIHTTFGDDPKTEVYVSWATELAHTNSYVLYGTDTTYGFVENSNAELVKFGDMSGDPWMDTMLVHHVRLTGLTPGTEYHYKCGGSAGLSSDCRFKTAPAGIEKFSYATMGDIQQYYNYNAIQDTCSRYLSRQDISFWIPLGDNVQEGGASGQWDNLFRNCKALFENVVVMPIFDYHDCLNDWEAVHYKSLFRFPSNGVDSFRGEWYSFKYSNLTYYQMIHRITVGSLEDDETPWLMNELSNDTNPWKLMSFHPPPYCTGGHGGDCLPDLIPTLLAAADSFNINGIFNGDSHHYEVTHPIADLVDPPVLSLATVNTNRDTAWANTSQGTIFYNSASFGRGLLSVLPPQPFTLDEDLLGLAQGMALVATIDMDTMIYNQTYCMNSPGISQGDIKFTYIVTNDMSGTTYELTSSSAGNGTVLPSGTNVYYENNDAVITATPNTGYAFSNWTGDVPMGEENTNPLTITMTADVSVTANFVALPTYTLTVNSGTGSGTFYETEQTSVTADTPPIGQEFNAWTGDVSAIADVNASTTTVTMPGADVTITATYQDIPTYTLTVTNGTGSGDYFEATSVAISPDTPPAGEEFNVWTGDISYLDNANLAAATVTMPAIDISLTATYRDTTIATYALTVTNGTGSGDYVEAAVVPIAANAAPVGEVFNIWTGDITNIADVNDSITTITMPASTVNISATYVSTGPTTYTVTFTIDDGNLPLENASVTFNSETQVTNANGVITFLNVSSGTALPYTVVLSGYVQVSSQITVVDADVNHSVSMILNNTGIDDEFSNIIIYPNPSSDIININNIENVKQIEIYSITNVLVRTYNTVGLNKIEIDVSNFSEGMYFIQIITDNGRITKQQIIY